MWVVNAEGVYIETRAYHSYLEDDILTAINEKYGTNFSTLTMQKVTGIYIGDDCPDWNAYEKIETTIYIKAVHDQGTFTFGFLSNDGVFQWQMFSESIAKLANAEGVVQSITIQQAQSYWENVLKPKLQTKWDVQSYVVEIDVTLIPGATIPNWQNYEIVE